MPKLPFYLTSAVVISTLKLQTVSPHFSSSVFYLGVLIFIAFWSVGEQRADYHIERHYSSTCQQTIPEPNRFNHSI